MEGGAKKIMEGNSPIANSRTQPSEIGGLHKSPLTIEAEIKLAFFIKKADGHS